MKSVLSSEPRTDHGDRYENIAKLERMVETLLVNVHDLQTALDFWLPNVPDDDHVAHARIAQDAWLLNCWEPVAEQDSAQDLGWITLNSNGSPGA